MTDTDGTTKSAEQLNQIFLKVVSTMAMAEGGLKNSEINDIDDAFKRYAGRSLTSWEIDDIAMSVYADDVSLLESLASVESSLNDGMKDELFHAASLIANSDGGVDDKEQMLLFDIAKALRISEARIQELLSR